MTFGSKYLDKFVAGRHHIEDLVGHVLSDVVQSGHSLPSLRLGVRLLVIRVTKSNLFKENTSQLSIFSISSSFNVLTFWLMNGEYRSPDGSGKS